MRNKMLLCLIPLLLCGCDNDSTFTGASAEIYPDVSYGYTTYENRGFCITWYDKTTVNTKDGSEIDYTVWYPYRYSDGQVLIFTGGIDYNLVEKYNIKNNIMYKEGHRFTIVCLNK